MRTLAQTVLPFKLEATDEMLTANAGLALFGEFIQGLGFSCWLAQEMPEPGPHRIEQRRSPAAKRIQVGGFVIGRA